MSSIHLEHFEDMSNYSIYPTPPSANDDSPVSYTTLSPASYTSENSLSPGVFQTSQLFVVSPNCTFIPFKTPEEVNDGSAQHQQPYLEITEQPIDKFRFRYKSEMTGTHGCLNGERSDKTRRMTYPTVKLHNYKGSAVIRCSIWQINHSGNDFMPHAHRLVKKKHGKEEADDPHELTVNETVGYEASFISMGIIHTAKKNIVSELIKKKTALMKEKASRENRTILTKKEEMEIKGLAEAESKSINLNVVCLRFDAFYVAERDVRYPICSAVFSHAINNLKSALTGELKIVRMDHCTSPASGGREIFLLVERVTKKNIKVRFYELDEDDNVTWEDFGRFNDLDVHHQYAIVLRTPPYKVRNITRPVNVFMELLRTSDNARSEPKEFTYTPSSNSGKPGCKRSRPNNFDSSDYDTASSGGSVGIPRTIQNMSRELDKFNLDDVNSSELDKMFINIDSEEFKNMFEKNKGEYETTIFPSSNSFSMDFPNQIHKRNSLLSHTQEQSKNFKKNVNRVVQEITEYLRTKPTNKNEIIEHIRHYISKFYGDYNALHMAAMIGDIRIIEYFVQLITRYELFDIVNISSKSSQRTALHIAVICEDEELTRALVTKCRADISIVDNDLNTPLHLASANPSRTLTEYLMSAINATLYIDKKNKNGNTPLLRAVKRGNLEVVKILCCHGADVNFRHPSNGYTPLRFAIDKRDVKLIQFLLYETKADLKMPDFVGVNPVQVVHQINNHEIVQIMEKYMEEHNISWESDYVKMELEEDDSEDEKEIFEEEEVKTQSLSLAEDDHSILQNMNHFTEECLDEISKEIETSGKWQDLIELLNLEHLLRMDTTIGESSPGRKILSIATQVASVKEIRGFLEALDEIKAVQAIDRMALQLHTGSILPLNDLKKNKS